MTTNNEMSLARAIKLFLGEQKLNTRRSYQYVLKYMEQYMHLTGLRLLHEIQPDHLIEMIQMVVERPSVKSVKTVNKYIKTVKVFFNWCLKFGFMSPPSPAEAVKRKKEPIAVPRSKAMPNDQYALLVDSVRWQPRAYALVLFLGDSGDRISGAANLKWTDLDLTNRQATVTEKGQEPRPVFYTEDCVLALMRWKLRQAGKDDGYVFSRDGKTITADALGQFFTRKCIKAGIGNWGPHSLRHRLGHNAYDEGIGAPVVQVMLGHRNMKTTLDSYFPRSYEDAKAAVDLLAKKRREKPEAPKIINDNLGTGS